MTKEEEISSKLFDENELLDLIQDELGIPDESIFDALEGKSAESLADEAIAKKKEAEYKRTLRKASDDVCEDMVYSILARYPGLVKESSHWTMTLIHILNKTEYEVITDILANNTKLDPVKPPDRLKLVQKHLSIAALENISGHIDYWVSEHDDWQEVEEIIPSSSYSAEKIFVIDNKAESSAEPDWGSW
jgi:hypothetical protein